MNNDFNKYVKYLSSDILTIKVRERSTGRLLELNPDIDDPFFDTCIRKLFYTGEYILISGNLPDKWK